MAFVRYGAGEKILDIIKKDECQKIECPHCKSSLGSMIRKANKDSKFEAEIQCEKCGKTFKVE